MRSRSLPILLLLALLLAGCASDEPADDGAGEPDDVETPTSGTPPAGDDDKFPNTPGGRFQRAFTALAEDEGAPGTFFLTMGGATLEREGASLTQSFYVNRTTGTTFYRALHRDATGKTVEDSTVARFNDTLATGWLNQSLLVFHDEGIPAFRGYGEMDATLKRLPVFLPVYLSPHGMLMQGGVLTVPISEPEAEDVEVNGTEVERLTYEGAKMVVDLEKETGRILRIQKEAARSTGGTVNVTATFTYGDARPELLERLSRAAALAPMDNATARNATIGARADAKNLTWTLQPNATLARVPLADAALHAYGRGDAGEKAPRFVVPLANGTGGDAKLALTFVDADADGFVSAGDTITAAVPAGSRDGMDDFDIRLVDVETDTKIVLA